MSSDALHRLLFLLPFPPHARGRHGGSRAIAELLRRIAPKYRVAVLYLRDTHEAPIDPDIAKLCEEVHAVERHYGRGGIFEKVLRRVRFVSSLLKGTPVWVQAIDVPEFADQVKRIVQDWDPELIELDYHIMGHYLRALEGSLAPRVLVVYEPGLDGAGRAAAKPSPLLVRLDRRAWRLFERKILRDVQRVVALTDADRLSIARRGVAVPIEVIGLGVTVPAQPADPMGATPPSVLFVGNFRHAPNLDSAFRLVHGIWPLVQRHHPDAVLSLVGEGAPAELLADAGDGIEVAGAVPDVDPFLDRAAACVAPLRQGGGMRVKVLEALAAGKAVVASPLAVAGLDVEDGRHFLSATTDHEFAIAVSRLLDDGALRRSLAEAAREWAVVNVSIERTASAFDALYRRMLHEAP